MIDVAAAWCHINRTVKQHSLMVTYDKKPEEQIRTADPTLETVSETLIFLSQFKPK